MNAIMNKTNNGKLIAALAILAMIVCALAVAVPAVDAEDVADVTYDGTYAADPVKRGDMTLLGGEINVSLLNYDGTQFVYKYTETELLNNQNLGNTGLKMTKVSDNEITISGTLKYQDDDSLFEKTDGERTSYDYGFLFGITGKEVSDGEFAFGSADENVKLSYYNSSNTWKTSVGTGNGKSMLVYVDAARESNTYYFYTGDNFANENEAKAAVEGGSAKAFTVNFDFTLAGTVEDAADLQTALNNGATDLNVTGGTINSEITLEAGQTVTLGSDVKFGTDAAFVVPTEATVNFNVPTNAENVTIKIAGGSDTTPNVVLKNVTGSFTVTGGSVVFKDTINSSMIIDLVTTGGSADVKFVNAVITSNSVITLGDGITYSVEGDVRLYGKILSSAPNGVVDGTTVKDDGVRTITVADGNSFTAYPGATIGKGVIVNGDGDIDVSSAMSTVTLNDDIESDFNASQSQKVVIADTLTIKSGYTMTILGELVINENCTLIIEDGAQLIVGSGSAIATGVTVNGVIEVEEGGEFTVDNAKDVTVNGTITSEGTVTINSKVTVKTGGSIEILEADESIIDVKQGLTIEAGGELSVSGKMKVSADGISNKGTVVLNNAILAADSDQMADWIYINMAADGAVVDVRSVIAETASVLRIQDNGLVFETDKNGNVTNKVENDTEDNAIHMKFAAGDGIRNLNVTEKVTSEKKGNDTNYSNFMYISGNLAVESENTTPGTVEITLRGVGENDGKLIVDTDATLTIGKGISFKMNAGDMLVNGNVIATADTAVFGTQNTGEITVSGMVTVNAEIDSINAFHYIGDDENQYHYYTTLATSIANGATDIDFVGNTEVMENVTIPAGTRVTADGNAQMTIGSLENRDVTVTVADSASIRDGKVVVNGTLVFENNKRDMRTAIESDVQIDEEPKMTYTNIYTALDNAESGKVTITRDTVTLNQDITVKEGVTLVIPANTTVQMWNKVILTVDGTVENSGKIVNIIGDNSTATTPGGFNPLTSDNKTNTEAAKIVVNGAFKSMEYTNYDDAADVAVNYYIPGAYFQIIDTEGSWYWITPVEDAAAVAANVEDGIEIFGTVTVGDVTFAGSTEEGAENVVVTVTGKLTAGTVTLSRADLVVDGQYDGNVATAVGSIAVVNANNFTVSDSFDEDDNEIMTLAEAPAQADDEIKAHSITVSSGIVTVNKSLNVNGVDFEVASGAIVMVTGKGAELTTEGTTDNDKLTVDGTLTVADAGMVDVGILTVKGTFNVIPADAEQKTSDGEATIGTLLVGIEIDEKTGGYVNATAATVSANAIGELGEIVVSAESTITGDLIDNEDYTEFYVEDALWITVYDLGTAGNIAEYNATTEKTEYGYAPTDLPTSEFVGWKNADGKLITATTGQDVAIGAPNEKVYAEIDYNVYHVVIALDNTVGSVAIDGQMLIYQNGVYVLPGGQELTAGQHTVSYTLAANYEGTPTLSSQNVTVSGMTFTLDGDYKDAEGNPITYYLSLGGATLADTSIVIEGGNGGSDSLGLTDYLLIILVILIVVMAIMVAMRLMRS